MSRPPILSECGVNGAAIGDVLYVGAKGCLSQKFFIKKSFGA